MVGALVLGTHRQHMLEGQDLFVTCCGTAKPLLSLEIFRWKISRHLKKLKTKNSKLKTNFFGDQVADFAGGVAHSAGLKAFYLVGGYRLDSVFYLFRGLFLA